METLCIICQHPGEGIPYLIDILTIPFIILSAILGLLFSNIYLKWKEDFSRGERFFITWFAQAYTAFAFILIFMIRDFTSNNYFPALAGRATVLPFVFGMFGAGIAYWVFTRSKHRASMWLLFERGFFVSTCIYLGILLATGLTCLVLWYLVKYHGF